MKLDLSKLGKSAGIDMSKALSGGQLEPTDMLSMLEAEGAQVQKVGPPPSTASRRRTTA